MRVGTYADPAYRQAAAEAGKGEIRLEVIVKKELKTVTVPAEK